MCSSGFALASRQLLLQSAKIIYAVSDLLVPALQFFTSIAVRTSLVNSMLALVTCHFPFLILAIFDAVI
jgi:hypothetical protein